MCRHNLPVKLVELKVAQRMQREKCTPNFLPGSEGPGCTHRAWGCTARAGHCLCTNEHFHPAGLGVAAGGGEELAAETSVGTAPVRPGWVTHRQGEQSPRGREVC